MSVRTRIISTALFATVAASTTAALAHVSASGPAIAGKSHIVTLGVGHGCEGADTIRIEVALPESVASSVRALPSAWGQPVLTKDDAGAITKVAWAKEEAEPGDDFYYEFQIRFTAPNAPFTRLYLPTTQVCRTADGEEITTEWSATHEEIAAAEDDEELEASPWLWIVPERKPGWNEYTAPDDIEDLSVFDDAQIVWVGDAAYSSNTTTMGQIEDEDGVEVLSEIEAGDEIWVKY